MPPEGSTKEIPDGAAEWNGKLPALNLDLLKRDAEERDDVSLFEVQQWYRLCFFTADTPFRVFSKEADMRGKLGG